MKLLKPAAIILTLFALLTLFMSGSVIFDLFGIREKEGDYVLFVVITNFVAGFLYLLGAYGLFNSKAWTTRLLSIVTGILFAGFLGLLFHINSGEAYETQTIKAMIFRIVFTALFAFLAWLYISKKQNKV
ncbi:MAG TPA: hypothetical protein PKN99_06795 [Cyclobacteriaceae bacterium]|nr:hypothetical protein [Cyclobacteriaceae bacterium]HNP07315.1 hypothetical protein [Cyclobacteriaceae bacterium]HRK55230.1 hypothetical protein [Cyclobacteriaceae bacterium]